VYNPRSCRNSEESEAVVDIQNIGQVPSFITKDGSEIRELLAYRNSCIRHQSLAEARLPPGASTTPHYHLRAEEIYYILEGSGCMRVAGEARPVVPGDAIAIPRGATHQVTNTGSTTLKFLCCCAPAYEHHDTILTAGGADPQK
jgi:mannose-6-phosphate isomerase-like protein (cupin superfamily)